MKKIKIVIGANFGDESKGLITHYFTKENPNSIVVFHNGSAQRGHTVDYNPYFRHVYHHFGCGTAEGTPTYFADTFWIHPMEFHREYLDLVNSGITPPHCYYDPNARIVTPFDMLVDHATEAYITWDHQAPEHGSCGYGTWCATDRPEESTLRMAQFLNFNYIEYETIMNNIYKYCCTELIKRGVDLDKIPEYKAIFEDNTRYWNTIENFKNDLRFFISHATPINFNVIYRSYDNIIFEGAQGLGLDKDCGKEWHTTSNTGLVNPYNMLKDKEDFEAEVCYVSRAYLTRHGIGDMDSEVQKKEINAAIIDKTNVPNEFQGSLRYGYVSDIEQKLRIAKDWSIVENDKRFVKSMAITHCNEFPDVKKEDYMSNNPYSVMKL